MSYTPLSYLQLLQIAEKETIRLEHDLKHANQRYVDHEQAGHRVSVKNMDSYINRKKDLFISVLYIQADLVRSNGRVAILKRRVAEETVREHSLAA